MKWETKTLGSLGDFSKGQGISKGDSQSGIIPCIRYGEIYTHHNNYVKIFYSHISETVAESSTRLRNGDLLFAGSGETKEEIGKCVAFIDNCKAYAGGDIIILFPKVAIDSLFFGYYLNSQFVSEQKASRGQGNAIVHISATSLSEIEICIPALIEEQRAIAAALSDIDGYISALEKLIIKKQNIKKGAMQELLTGKRRLPGFDGEWIEYKLGDFNIRKGSPITQNQIQAGNIPVIAGGKTAAYYHNDYNREGNVITISASGASAGFVNFWTHRIFASDCSTIEESNEYCVRFIYYWLLNNQYLIYKLQTGGAQPHVQPSNLKPIEICLPHKNEQTAIATILSDVDVEIDALTAKLNKLRNIKQGMMQELLTGRIRLVAEDSEVIQEPKVIKLSNNKPQTVANLGDHHNQEFDDAVMIAGIVDVLYSDKYPLGRKKVQKCLYLLRRHQDESIAAFKKKAAGPYADEVRYKGGEPIARKAQYITTTTIKDKGTIFARGANIDKALHYMNDWGRQPDIQWVANKLKYKKVDYLELLATVDMAICDLTELGVPVSVESIKHLIANNKDWAAKLEKQTFSDDNISYAIQELKTLL